MNKTGVDEHGLNIMVCMNIRIPALKETKTRHGRSVPNLRIVRGRHGVGHLPSQRGGWTFHGWFIWNQSPAFLGVQPFLDTCLGRSQPSPQICRV